MDGEKVTNKRRDNTKLTGECRRPTNTPRLLGSQTFLPQTGRTLDLFTGGTEDLLSFSSTRIPARSSERRTSAAELLVTATNTQ